MFKYETIQEDVSMFQKLGIMDTSHMHKVCIIVIFHMDNNFRIQRMILKTT